ncbi:hypothetical protein CR513_14098, partial [Mucuna pruriens]
MVRITEEATLVNSEVGMKLVSVKHYQSSVSTDEMGENLTLGHEIMHDTEKTLLHFPGVLCAEDDHFPPSKIKIYASGGCHVVSVTITRELSSIVNSEVRSTKILQLFRSGTDTPVTHPAFNDRTLIWLVLYLFSGTKRETIATSTVANGVAIEIRTDMI